MSEEAQAYGQSHGQNEMFEMVVVVGGDTRSDPWAVVVDAHDTNVAVGAVYCARGSNNLAFCTVLQLYSL